MSDAIPGMPAGRVERLPETEEGVVVWQVPFPDDLAALKSMSPIIIPIFFTFNIHKLICILSKFFSVLGLCMGIHSFHKRLMVLSFRI